MVLQDCYCGNCGKMYISLEEKWCELCQINNFKKKFVNWSSGNEKIDEFIQEMQLKVDKWNYIIVEWIPYNQFNNIKEIGKDGFNTVYSAIWTDGPLDYNKYYKKYTRKLVDKEVALKRLYNSQNITNEFLNEEV